MLNKTQQIVQGAGDMLPESVKHGGDVTSVALLVGHFVGMIPTILAPTLTMIWMVLRIYETATVQQWLDRRKKKKNKDISAD